ncbi:hypothetical protein E2C01_023084 [Portunus trituberculatus]|uniref:Uncharacterized protein n=1 Tax=Portunus trituberculatus TaxID=210409 RepID=A0A5B7EA85_PORTR|nr:hypothetical protein [Portunus trituberculatus]
MVQASCGPTTWPAAFPECGKLRQSPVAMRMFPAQLWNTSCSTTKQPCAFIHQGYQYGTLREGDANE